MLMRLTISFSIISSHTATAARMAYLPCYHIMHDIHQRVDILISHFADIDGMLGDVFTMNFIARRNTIL